MKSSLHLILGLGLTLFTQAASAQQQSAYTLSFPNAAHHEAEVKVTFTGLKADTLTVLMPRSSPGRYALHEFGKNVYNVKATNAQGNTLAINRTEPNEWQLTGHKGSATITYTLFADHADGTYAGVDETHAHLNMPATLLYTPELEKAPAKVTFNVPQGSNWQVATQLKHEQGTTYSAPDFQYLMDSPAELSAFDFAEWDVNGQKIQIAMHHIGTKAQFEEYVSKAKKIVAEQQAIFGELPKFDFGRYTFLACYMPQAVGDGMEHRNSTYITSSRPLATGMSSMLGTLSHEFFHAWNVERIRPASLEPFDFQAANMSEALWLAEGFTSYFDDLANTRAGLQNLEKYASNLTGDLNYVLLSPGPTYHSLVEMSKQAPYVDAARSVDPNNRHNTFTSYYVYGAVTGLGLDLTLRQKYNTTLDNFMQALWKKYGKPEKPYTLANLEETLAEVSGDKVWAASFFKKSILGSELMDYTSLLAQAGLELRKAKPGIPTLGPMNYKYSKEGATLDWGTFVTSAAYKAGLERNDLIQSINGRKIRTEKEMKKALSKQKPGDTVSVTFVRHGKTRTTNLILDEENTLQLATFESVNKAVTPEIETFRTSWIGAKAK